MPLAHKSGTIIRVCIDGNPTHNGAETTAKAYYYYEVTGMGPIQNTDALGEVREITFTIAGTDDADTVITKAKTAVDADIAAG